ncbi:capsular polysaccharide biosynthesis protein [Achromobacter insolitus]|uniref:capsular polysaccharide biosynthesis protein n=1 Tax=Achromobacter insolitus TaxID=217204 RepID=UPI003670CA29
MAENYHAYRTGPVAWTTILSIVMDSFAAVHWLDWGIWRQRHLAARLGIRTRITAGFTNSRGLAAFVGWGLKRSGLRARRLARVSNTACWLLEDGFLRSIESGNSDSYSLIVDDLGIYYDASRTSRLEVLVSSPLSDEERTRAGRLIHSWCTNRLSKYNEGRDVSADALPLPYVLVVDQTAGDAAISYGRATPASFQEMLDDALRAHADCHVVVRIHPEVVNGRKKGHYNLESLRNNPRIRIVADGSHPAVWIENAQAVYTVTSQLGFEALLWSKQVHVYGMPFYAGWGLTHDKLPPPARRQPVSLEQLVHACLVGYARYFNPEDGQRCEIEVLINWIALQRYQRQRFPPSLIAYGFSRWKQPFVREFLAGSSVTFTKTLPPASPRQHTLVTWGHKHTAELEALDYKQNVLRIEDGFLRSVGLGADLIRPLSWVIDPEGIYYDARNPSKLEQILSDTHFSQTLCIRAATLREQIVKAGITKYNLRHPEQWLRPQKARRVVVAIGQVETDAAIRYGTGAVRRNIDLLKSVRDACPDAWLLYKPHPDVRAGLRQKGEGEAAALQWCDEVIGDVPYESLLRQVDEVHVLTSLAGFEALLRHVPVVTWGQPFYAGWGLTADQNISEAVRARRPRRLTLDELVAGSLILYPTYVSRYSRHFCSPERAVQELLEWRTEDAPSRLRRIVGLLSRKP